MPYFKWLWNDLVRSSHTSKLLVESDRLVRVWLPRDAMLWLAVTFVYSSKRLKIRSSLLWNANRKPQPSFQMLPFPMTLSDHNVISRSRYSSTSSSSQTVAERAILTYLLTYLLTWQTNSKSYMTIDRRHFQWHWTPNPDKIRRWYVANGTRSIHI